MFDKIGNFLKNTFSSTSTTTHSNRPEITHEDLSLDVTVMLTELQIPAESSQSRLLAVLESEKGKKTIKKAMAINKDYNVLGAEKEDVLITVPGESPIDYLLPNEVKLLILSYLTVKELGNVAVVSKHWGSLSSTNAVWNKFIKFYGEPMPGKTSKQHYEEIIKRNKPMTNPEFYLKDESKRYLIPPFYNRMVEPALENQRNVIHYQASNIYEWKDGEDGDESAPSKRFIFKS